MLTTRQNPKISIWLLAGILLLPVAAKAQYYDLTVGTERHFDYCSGLTGVCPVIGEYRNTAIEKVIGETDIDGKTWAIVTWTVWSGFLNGEGQVRIVADTSYYLMEGSLLFEYSGGIEQPIFDYGFSIGDSVMTILASYLSEEDMLEVHNNYGVGQDGVASVILIDTLLSFADGVYRNVLWGDDTLRIEGPSGVIEYIPPHELEFTLQNDLPVPMYAYVNPFYYISGMGIILTPFNHRGRMMCGYKKPDRFDFGCDASVITSIEEPSYTPGGLAVLQNYPNPFNPSTIVRFNIPDAGMVKLSMYDMTGKLLKVLKNETMPSGDHQMNLHMGSSASGIYLLVLKHNQSVTTHSIVLVK